MKIFKYHFSKTKTILTLIGICISIYYMLIYKLDIRAITIITLLLGYITNVFVGVTSLIGLIPVIGPLIVNILTLPFIWIINGIGYISSIYVVKKGYSSDVMQHRMLSIVLIIGIILGYILGHLIPVR